LVPKPARDGGKGVKVLFRVRWDQQQEDQIDWSRIDRLIVNGPVESHEQAEKLVKRGNLGVRDGDARPYARRSQTLARFKRVADLLLRQSGHRRRPAGKFREKMRFAGGLEPDDHAVGRSEIADFHGTSFRSGPDVGEASCALIRRQLQAITDPKLGQDVRRARRVRFELLPEAPDEHPEILHLIAVRRPPNLAQQMPVRKHLSGVRDEMAK